MNCSSLTWNSNTYNQATYSYTAYIYSKGGYQTQVCVNNP